MRKKSNEDAYYVDKSKFTEQVSIEAKTIREAKEKGTPIPPLSNYVSECIFKICTKLSYSQRFRNYTYIEEMVGDALLDCVAGVKNYDPTKQTRSGKPNAFGYFTQISWYAFVRRINLEKKNHEKTTRYKNSLTVGDVSCQQIGHEDDSAAQVLNAYIDEQIMFDLKNKDFED